MGRMSTTAKAGITVCGLIPLKVPLPTKVGIMPSCRETRTKVR